MEVQGQEGARVGGHNVVVARGHKGGRTQGQARVQAQDSTKKKGGYKGGRMQGQKSTRVGGYNGRRVYCYEGARAYVLAPFHLFALAPLQPTSHLVKLL